MASALFPLFLAFSILMITFSCDPNCLECIGHLASDCVICGTSAHLAGSLPNSCVCDAGLWPDGDYMHCRYVCHPDCATCSGSLNSDCQSCGTHAHLSDSAPNFCVCDVGYCNENPDAMHCSAQPCHPDCATCSGCKKAQCLTCGADAYLLGGKCRCDSGRCPNPDAMHCNASCHPSCLTCSGCNDNECDSCYPNAILHGVKCRCAAGFCMESPDASNCQALTCDSSCATCSGCLSTDCQSCGPLALLMGTGACACSGSAYPSPDTMHCSTLCDVSCATCSGPTDTQCLSCFANAGVSAGVCSCVLGFFPAPDSSTCSQCVGPCLACSSASRCWICGSNASLPSLPGSCACISGFYPDPASPNCLPCLSSCKTCSASSVLRCTSCFPSAKLASTPPSECICENGYYANPTSATCFPCDPKCGTCVGPGANQCLSCLDGAELAETAPASCQCKIQYFLQNTKCVLCNTVCFSCAGAGPDKCTMCYKGAFLASSAPSSCLCNPGFYPNPGTENCVMCDQTCQTCNSFPHCLTCKGLAALQSDFTCQCPAYTFASPDPSNCVPCASGCLQCSSASICSRCDSDWYQLETGCARMCPFGYVLNERSCVKEAIRPPEASLFVDYNNSLTVTFSMEMQMNITTDDVSVDVEDVEGIHYGVKWTRPIVLNRTSFLLNIVLSAPRLPSDNLVTLTFVQPSDIVDQRGVPIEINHLIGKLHPYGPYVPSVDLNSTIRPTAQAFAQGSIGASIVVSIINGSPGPLWSILNQLQLITYIPMTTLTIPKDLGSTLLALNFNAFVPNPFGYVFTGNETDQTPPSFTDRYQIQTTLFLLNMGLWVTIGALLLLSVPPLYLLSILQIPYFSNFFRKILLCYRWSIALRWWVQSYLDFGVFAMLQLYKTHTSNDLHNSATALNFSLSVIVTVCFGATPVVLLAFIWARKEKLTSRNDPLFNKRWCLITEEFSKDKRLSSILYYEFFVARRFLFALVIIFLSENPLAQGLISIALCFIVSFTQIFAYVTFWRPFETRIDQFSAFLSETSSLLVFVISILFEFDLTPTAAKYIEIVGVWMIFSAIAGSGVMSAIRSGILIYGMVTTYKKKSQARMITRDQVSTTLVEEPTLTVSTAEHKMRNNFIVD